MTEALSEPAGDSPRFSVVIEGYNEERGLGDARETLAGLAKQTVGQEIIEVILVGGPAQQETWRELRAEYPGFHRIRIVVAEGAHYYQLKNHGVAAACGTIVAHIDSDAVPVPQWLAEIDRALSAGADVTVGPTRFRVVTGLPLPGWLLDIASSITWGFVLGSRDGEATKVRGFLSHNVGLRGSVAHTEPYDERYGRTCAGSMLYSQMQRQGFEFAFNPEQCVYHTFTPVWWILGLHARFGYEVYCLRRLDSPVVNQDAMRLGWLEPAATMLWHVIRDFPQWVNFSRMLGWRLPGMVLAMPVLLMLSVCARSSEMIAMYRTRLDPEKMRVFALRL